MMVVKKYRVIEDEGFVYETGSVLTSIQLINDYLGVCNEQEDADLIGYIVSLKEEGTDETISEAVNFIAESWLIDLEEIKEDNC